MQPVLSGRDRVDYCEAMERSEHQTRLDRALVSAYRATRYRVFGAAPFEMSVDRRCAPLQALMREAGARGAAFVTAWNPHGETQPPALNRERQDALRDTLRERGLHFIEGFGAHAQDERRGEDSLLVLRLDRLAACMLGETLGQNAILWSGSNAIPRLVLLR